MHALAPNDQPSRNMLLAPNSLVEAPWPLGTPNNPESWGAFSFENISVSLRRPQTWSAPQPPPLKAAFKVRVSPSRGREDSSLAPGHCTLWGMIRIHSVSWLWGNQVQAGKGMDTKSFPPPHTHPSAPPIPMLSDALPLPQTYITNKPINRPLFRGSVSTHPSHVFENRFPSPLSSQLL